MTTSLNGPSPDDRAAAERRAWADDEVTIYPPGAPIPAPADDDEGDDEE